MKSTNIYHNFIDKHLHLKNVNCKIFGNEIIIKLRNFQSENLPEIRKTQIYFKIFMMGYQRATNKGSPSVAHT